MKKLIDSVETLVEDSLVGFAAAHVEHVRLHGLDSRGAKTGPLFVTRAADPTPGNVSVLSGGGSGHEPMHAGFIGPGMLDAAVPGPMFTSPTADQIAAAISAVDAGAGVLAIVKNYTGDVMNFALAAEMAQMDGIEVASVVVDDDVAVEDSTHTAGRRGVAGTVIVEKMAGAAAERGDTLGEVTEVARAVVANTRSMGVALTAGTVPHVGRPGFDLGEDEIELGVGIHGEPGRARQQMAPACEITRELVEPVVADLGLRAGERVLLLVNGMGGTPLIELYLVYARARALLEAAGIEVARSLVGEYVTSLEMQGASVTVTRLTDELAALWDAPVNTAALRW